MNTIRVSTVKICKNQCFELIIDKIFIGAQILIKKLNSNNQISKNLQQPSKMFTLGAMHFTLDILPYLGEKTLFSW